MTAESLISLEDILCVVPALIVFLVSLLPITIKVLSGNREHDPLLNIIYCIGGLSIAMVSALALMPTDMGSRYVFSHALVVDNMSVLAISVVILLTIMTLLLSKEHMATKGAQFSEYLFLLLNASVGMIILVMANDLIVMFIGIEMMSLCLYLLIALSNEQRLSKEAAFKYFILGSFASAIFLYGVAFLYGAAGTTYIHELVSVAAVQISTSYIYLFGVTLVILGFAFKVAIVPFHAWTPDVYEGSPTPLTAYMATAVKLVSFVAFLRILVGDYLIYDFSGGLIDVMQWLAVITMTLGNIAAIMQSSLKRMLAYSSIAHSGYIMMGLIAASMGAEGWAGATGVLFYVIAYSIMTLGAFSVCILLEKDESTNVQIEDLKGLGKRNPWTAAWFSLFMLSLAGIPPLIGFFGKFFIFAGVLQQGLIWLAIWGAINSVISVYYYLRPMVLMYMSDEEGVSVSPNYRLSHMVVALSGILVIGLGLASDAVYKAVQIAVVSLF